MGCLKFIGDASQKILGVFCQGLAWVLILSIAHSWFRDILPVVTDLNSSVGVMHFIASGWFCFNAAWNHYMASTVNPGYPLPELLPKSEPSEADKLSRRGESWSRFCCTCWQWKPPRTHHCYFCGVCVLKMDHHCPWINNCVGHKNQKYFILMLLYISLATGHITTVLFFYIKGMVPAYFPHKAYQMEPAMGVVFLLSFTICIAMVFFLAWNCYLLLSNQTAVECVARRTGNPFDLGSGYTNLQEVFGYYSSSWMMIMPTVELIDSNGHEYNTSGNSTATVSNPNGRTRGNGATSL